MNRLCIRYWFEFEIGNSFKYPPGVGIGCGVTALNYSDAIDMISSEIFKNYQMPKIRLCIENVDIGKLDQGHVIPNMKSPVERGIWFPLL